MIGAGSALSDLTRGAGHCAQLDADELVPQGRSRLPCGLPNAPILVGVRDL